METFWKIIFYLLNVALYPFLIWWVLFKILLTSMAAPDLIYFIFFFVLIFLVVSTISYILAHFFWGNGYWEMFFKNLGIYLSTLYILYLIFC